MPLSRILEISKPPYESKFYQSDSVTEGLQQGKIEYFLCIIKRELKLIGKIWTGESTLYL